MLGSFLIGRTTGASKTYKLYALAVVVLTLVVQFAPVALGQSVTYVNGYPTINGNYVDCNGNVDNDMNHHTTNPGDTDPAHHVGQNCPVGSYIYNYQQSQSVSNSSATTSTQTPSGTVSTPAPAPTTSTTASLTCNQVGQNTFVGCYYTDQNFGNLGMVRADSSINFDWGGGSPSSQIPADHFSVIWQGSFNFDAGDYTFTATGDDGVRLSVDGTTVIDKMIDQAPTTYTAVVSLAAGQHTVVFRYYENAGGAVAKLSWTKNASVTSVTPVSSTPTSAPSQNSTGNPLAGAQFYRDPNNNAQQWINNNGGQTYNVSLMQKVASQPNAVWLGGWNSNVAADASNIVNAAKAQGALPIFIVYNIPNRDCGGYSAGGAQTVDAYKQWIRAVASGIGNNKAAVVLEPDAVALTSCLSSSDLQARYGMLSDAVSVLKSQGNIAVYIDAGHPNWISAQDMAGRLQQAGIANADGFALNISNFTWTNDNIMYGQQISSLVGGKHFIIDTSRNGQGPASDNAWCNPSGRGLGAKPTTNTGNSLVDAFIWGKDPGGSDGNCNGGPSAGVFWPDYALGLASRSSW